MEPKILGYVMARNEWPLLEICLSHVLQAGVDHVVVLDHGSDDGTDAGLRLMQADFPGRITVTRVESGPFFQEAATALAAVQHDAGSFDWFYVFDADELLLVGPGSSLGELLAEIPDHYDAVRYEIDQWVAPFDMDASDLESYTKIQFRGQKNLFRDIPGQILADEIINSNLNFFDVPFPSKVIVRTHRAHSVAAGAHFLNAPGDYSEFAADPTVLSCAHLPLRSSGHLQNKVEQGFFLERAGFPKDIGWQSQMLLRMERDLGLDDFWKNHSVSEEVDGILAAPELPTVVKDERVANLISEALRFREDRPSANLTRQQSEVPLTWAVAVEALNRQISQKYCALAERDNALAERDNALAERDNAISSRNDSERQAESIKGRASWRLKSLQSAVRNLRFRF